MVILGETGDHALCVPLGVPGYMVGWSCPASAWPLQESPPPISTAEWAGLSLCLDHKLLCPHWSTRSHIHPLERDRQNHTVKTESI